MADAMQTRRARMACRIYLKLHAAGPAGAPVITDDAFGPGDDPDADFPAAVAVVARFVDDTILDEPSHSGGVPHYALTAGMRQRLDENDRLASLRAAVAGGAEAEDVVALEAMVRTGRPDSPAL